MPTSPPHSDRLIILITTGGTIEKTYDERTGTLENRRSVMDTMLAGLRLIRTRIEIVDLLSKDSLYMTDADRAAIARAVREANAAFSPSTSHAPGGIVISHGTDTLHLTGEHIHSHCPNLRVPVILTGAMRPFEMQQSDALQNLNEAIFAAGVLVPGVYCVAHGWALQFPGVVKDHAQGTFVKP